MPGVKVSTSSGPIVGANGFAGIAFVDMDGDGVKDLVVTGSDNRLSIYRNHTLSGPPVFDPGTEIQGENGPLSLPATVSGRFDIVDWDNDGLPDLITGDYDGSLLFYRNTGTRASPAFGSSPIPFRRTGTPIKEAYNVFPRAYDFNHDGIRDLCYGINWGYFKFLVSHEGPGTLSFPSDLLALNADQELLNVRSFIADDTIPDFADLNGDGVLDMITGGLNGKLYWMPGIAYDVPLSIIEGIIGSHQTDLGSTLMEDESIRADLFGQYQYLRTLSVELLPTADQAALRERLLAEVERYGGYLRSQYHDPNSEPYVSYLAGQVWVSLLDLSENAPARAEVSKAIGLMGVKSNLLVDVGMLYLENSRSTQKSQKALYDIAASIPKPLQAVELVMQREYLVTSNGTGDATIQSRGSVNVFAQVGDYSESFAPDAANAPIDGFAAVVAHELNHNVEFAAARLYPWYWNRKAELLENASPPDIRFLDHTTEGFGVDWPATKTNFYAKGFWDGKADTWTASYDNYWSSGPGAGYDRHWLRDNLRYCLENPQEAFATLSNQYFASSEVMFQLSLSRWHQGITNCINEFLFFADVYSIGLERTFLYQIDTNASVSRVETRLQRNSDKHIWGIEVGGQHYDFDVDERGNVLDIFVSSADAPPPLLLITRRGANAEIGAKEPYNFRYDLESSTDLIEWQRIVAVGPGTNPPFLVENPEAGVRRFFKAQRDW